MELPEAHREILHRAWNWNETPDEETEALLARLEARVRPQVPQVEWDNDGGWSSSACEMVVFSAPVPRDYHNNLEFWRRFEGEALYVLLAPISARARVYTTAWNVFPKRHRELLEMSTSDRRSLPTEWDRTYGPFMQPEAPTDDCRVYEQVVRDAFAAEDIFGVSRELLAMPSPLQDFSYSRDGTLWSTLFGIT
jgi:hypothetical protein